MALINPPAWEQGGSYDARRDRVMVTSMLERAGVVSSTDMVVSAQSSPNMTVRVSSGLCYVDRSGNTLLGYYSVINDSSTNVTVPAADPTNPRIDLVVVRVYDSAYSGSINEARFEVVTGSPSSSPVAPSVPATSIEIARITVGANATSVTNANISTAGREVAALRTEMVRAAIPTVSWQSWVPGISNFGGGASSITGRYRKDGTHVDAMMTITLGSGFALNSNLVLLTLPVNASSTWTVGDIPVGLVSITDSGTGYYSSWVRLQSTTQVALHDVYAGKIGWAPGDKFAATFSYEAAV